MDIARSFTFMFEDQGWIAKLAIGGAILLVGFLLSWLLGLPLIAALILVLGYGLTVTKNVVEGSTQPLPEWSNIGALFSKGLYAAIGLLVLFLPGIILSICAAALGSLFGARSGNNAGGIFTIVALCLNCLVALYSLVVGLYVYAPLTRFALSGQLSTFWDFRGNLAFIQSNLSNYIVAILITIITGIIGSLGVIACVIGLPFTLFYAQMVNAHLFGQVARGTSATDVTTLPPMTPPMEPITSA